MPKSLPQITQIDAEGIGEKQLSNYKITNSKIKQVDSQENTPKNLPQNTQIIAERVRRRAKIRRSMRRRKCEITIPQIPQNRKRKSEQLSKSTRRRECVGANPQKRVEKSEAVEEADII